MLLAPTLCQPSNCTVTDILFSGCTARCRSMTASNLAYSLADAVRKRASLQVLNLSKSPDLICENFMCAKAGQSCYCKLLVTLQRLPHLQELDLSNNGLTQLPEILTADVLPNLTTLRMCGNQLEAVPMGILELPCLKELYVEENPLRGESLIAASAKLRPDTRLHLDSLQQSALEAHKNCGFADSSQRVSGLSAI